MTVPLLVLRVFQRRLGLNVQKKAAAYLESVLEQYNIPDDELEATLELIAHAYKKQESSYVVTKEALELTVTRLLHNANGGSAVYMSNDDMSADNIQISDGLGDVNLPGLLHVINAIQLPKWHYSIDQKAFLRDVAPVQFISEADAKSRVFRERYNLIKQRILRNDHFRPSTFSSFNSDRYFTLTPISSLRGSEGASFVVFGMLAQLDEGRYYLEEPSASVELDLSNITNSTGLFTESCFVIAEGVYTEDKVLKVRTLGMPPPENRKSSLEIFGQIDFLGAPQDIYDEARLLQIEKKYDSAKMVILSDVWLDSQPVMSALRKLLKGYATTVPPLTIIMTGSFTSYQYLYNGKQRDQYKDHWNALADLILLFPTIVNATTFIFVPGPEDPGGGQAMPQPPIPTYFVQRLVSRLPHVLFTTNPTRIKYCTQEIVIMRDNLLSRMHRNCIIPPNTDQLARTIIDQSYLSPLPLHTRPVFWGAEHAMRLYPVPDTIVVADKAERYTVAYEDVQVMNPGSFATSQFYFLVYYPSSRSTETSCIPQN